MLADEIVALNRTRITQLLKERADDPKDSDYTGPERRQIPRWPFPVPVELRPANGDGTRQWFGTCRDLNESGMGMSTDEYFEPGTLLEISFHLPEASFYGHASVRYCQAVRGQFMTGVEFIFDD